MGGHKNKNKSSPLVLPLTESDLALQAEAVRTSLLQGKAFDLGIGGLENLFSTLDAGDFTAKLLQAAQDGGTDPLTQAILKQEQARIEGGGISESQRTSIRGAADAAIGIAESDISEFAQGQFGTLVQSLTPSLGLRPGDSPIQDRGGVIAAEAVRQQGQAVRGIQGQAFEAELNLPLAQSGANAALLGIQGQLAQEGFNRQLALADTAFGAAATFASPGPLSSTVSAVKQPKVAGQVSKGVQTGGGILTS